MGWWPYRDIEGDIKRRGGNVDPEALERKSRIEWDPCGYFGSRYAIRKYKKSLEVEAI